MMFMIIVLQKYYGLSEEETEFQILDRFSFQRFLGLPVSDKVPDKNTIWDFKERLGAKGVLALFEQFEAKLAKKGLMGNQGKIVDASFVDVPRQRNSRHENEAIKRGERPASFEQNRRRGAQKDSDARWAKKNDETHLGYKNHIKVDAVTKFISTYSVTAANTHDSQAMPELLCRGDGDIFADSAYSGAPLEKELEALELGNLIHEKGTSGRPLSAAKKEINRLKSGIRARVEHVFGFQTTNMGADRIRTIGIKRARCSIGLGNLVYNLFRYASLSNEAA